MSKNRQFANLGEYIYWAYANLQMLHFAISTKKNNYDSMCFMVRSKAYKSYIEGRWNIHDLTELNISKVRHNNFCWYCGRHMPPEQLTIDHVFPRSKGGNKSDGQSYYGMSILQFKQRKQRFISMVCRNKERMAKSKHTNPLSEKHLSLLL